MSLNKKEDSLIIGHMDQTVILFNLESQQSQKICTHTSIPYALSCGKHVSIAGNDNKVLF